MSAIGILCSAAAVVVLASSAHAQQSPTIIGFEAHNAGRSLVGWTVAARGFEAVLDSVTPLAGRFSLRTRRLDGTSDSAKSILTSVRLPAAGAAGRRLHLTGYIRTEAIRSGYASFWLRVDGAGVQTLALDNMKERAPRGTTPWTRYDIELPVDSSATWVTVGVYHVGDGSAWYDSLSVQVVGDAMPRTVAVFTPEPRLVEDMTRLLSDAELALPPDSLVVPEDSAYTSWVRTHAHPIRSLGASDFSDLHFLAPLLTNKRIVQLGESSHGVGEFTMAKVRLIRYLHEELGYDVVAFESPIHECERAQKNSASLSPDALMRGCINAVWQSDEALPLFAYVKSTQASDRPLVIAGFDVQATYTKRSVRSGLLQAAVASVDTSYARRVRQIDSAVLTNPTQTFAAANLIAFYDSLVVFLRSNRRAIEAAHPDDPTLALIAQQTAASAGFLVRMQAASVSPGQIRDRGMAENLDFLLNELYPGKKVVVWAHNAHIRHLEKPDAVARSSRNMGSWVADRHRPELYTIGLYMYRGSGADNDRTPYPIVQSQSGSFESILHQAPWRYTFVDFSKEQRERGSEWIWTAVNALEWGRQPDRFIPRDEYDGVLFIDTVHPPRYR
ncbi:MAG: erythromycin esterase family protein [Gemmatimonadaceae bacterium]